jgi:hypothetical protein
LSIAQADEREMPETQGYQKRRRPGGGESRPRGKSFMPKRIDARFCSAACKQKAYRKRKPVAEPEWSLGEPAPMPSRCRAAKAA